jgi:predicted component of type VI protein secretion system
MSDFARFVNNLLRRIGLGGQKRSEDPPQAMENLMRKLERTQGEELTCDEALALLDQFAEMDLRGEQAEHVLPLVKHHMQMCPDCREEYEALLRILRSEIT